MGSGGSTTEVEPRRPADLEPTPDEMRRLLEAAREVRKNAYAPYSGFPVGAAILDARGRVYPGANVENASYGLSTCAERNALGRAVSEGAGQFLAVAIVGPDDEKPLMPCGSCRQILWELAPRLVVATPSGNEVRSVPLRDLLPDAFDSESLPRKA